MRDLVNAIQELEHFIASGTMAQQEAIGLASPPLRDHTSGVSAEAPQFAEQAESVAATEQPSAPPLPPEPVFIRLKPECPICMEPIESMACGPCG